VIVRPAWLPSDENANWLYVWFANGTPTRLTGAPAARALRAHASTPGAVRHERLAE
jgi:hypothetical protein